MTARKNHILYLCKGMALHIPGRITAYVALMYFVFGTTWLHAQNKAIVSGVVKDSLGQPVADVLIGREGNRQAATYSDSLGRFSCPVEAGKNTDIYFYHPGFISQKRNVLLKPGEELKLLITMRGSASSNLGQVVIKEQGHNLQEVNTLDPKVVKDIPMPSGDFNAILATQPGVVTRSELSSDYSVRGGSYDENLVYVNGIEIYRPQLINQGEEEGLSFINPDMVQSVDFSAGGFEAKYGDKMSSVLDVTYKKPTSFAASASGSLLGGDMHVEGTDASHRFTYIAGIRYKTNQYLLNSLDVQGSYKPRFADAQVYMTYALSDKWELDVLGNYALDEFNFVPQSENTSFGTISQAYNFNVQFLGQELDRFQTITGATSLNYNAGGKLKMQFTVSAYNDNETQNFDILGDYLISALQNNGQVGYAIGQGLYLNHARNDIGGMVYSFQYNSSYTFSRSDNLLWGAEYQRQDFASTTSQWNLVDSAGYSLPYSNSILNLQNVVKANAMLDVNRLEGFAENIYHWQTADTGLFTLTAGVRGNYSDLNHEPVVSPRATLAYKPNWKKDILFRLSSGYYFQPPFYRELIQPDGYLNTSVKDQESIHFVGGADWNFKAWNRPFKFVVEAYYKDLVNVIPYNISDVYINYYPDLTAHGYAEGVDMKINGDFVKGMNSWFSLSVLNAKYKINNANYYLYYNSYGQQILPGVTANTTVADSSRHTAGYIPMPTDQEVTASLFFEDYLPRFPDFKVHLNLIFGAGIPFGPPAKPPYADTLRTPFYQRVDLGFSYLLLGRKGQVKKGFTRYLKTVWVGLEVFNLLQANNVISYNWISDVSGRQYAIPNYLTAREVNVTLSVAL